MELFATTMLEWAINLPINLSGIRFITLKSHLCIVMLQLINASGEGVVDLQHDEPVFRLFSKHFSICFRDLFLNFSTFQFFSGNQKKHLRSSLDLKAESLTQCKRKSGALLTNRPYSGWWNLTVIFYATYLHLLTPCPDAVPTAMWNSLQSLLL